MKKVFLILALLFSACVTAEARSPFFNNPNIRFYQPRAVGYQPHIVWLPSGTYFRTGPVIVGPNRRHVRMGINFGFSGVTRVSTFNFVTGETRNINNR